MPCMSNSCWRQVKYRRLKKAQEKVDELNARFADWYYVISDDVYKKIHLTRADVVKKKEVKPGEGDGIGDFKALEEGGLKPATPPATPPTKK